MNSMQKLLVRNSDECFHLGCNDSNKVKAREFNLSCDLKIFSRIFDYFVEFRNSNVGSFIVVSFRCSQDVIMLGPSDNIRLQVRAY